MPNQIVKMVAEPGWASPTIELHAVGTDVVGAPSETATAGTFNVAQYSATFTDEAVGLYVAYLVSGGKVRAWTLVTLITEGECLSHDLIESMKYGDQINQRLISVDAIDLLFEPTRT